MRDTLKPREYFIDYIIDLDRRVDRFAAKIDRGEVRDDRMAAVKAKVFSLRLDKVIAMYSAGESLSAIKKEFEQLIEGVSFANARNRYVEIVQLLAVAVMLGVSVDKARRVKNIIEREGLEDFLLGFLMSFFWKDTVVSDATLHENPYKKLKPVIAGVLDPVDGISDYLSKSWYRGHSDMGWYDSHDHESEVYSGYWSFESGAILQMLGADDNALRSAKYYPYDMANFLKNRPGSS